MDIYAIGVRFLEKRDAQISIFKLTRIKEKVAWQYASIEERDSMGFTQYLESGGWYTLGEAHRTRNQHLEVAHKIAESMNLPFLGAIKSKEKVRYYRDGDLTWNCMI